jgi:hypothetical protein
MHAARWLPLRIMSQSHGRRWPWVIAAAAFGLLASGAALWLSTAAVPLGPRWGPRGLMAAGVVMFSPMGAVVATRRPHNRIGVIYCFIGLLCAVQFFAEEYAVFALLGWPGRLPGGVWLAWLQNWIWVPAIAFYLVLVPLLLPEGRLPSARWRPVVGFTLAAVAVETVLMAIQPGPLQNFSRVDNPLPLVLLPLAVVRAWQQGALSLLNLAILAAALALVSRVRRAPPVERQQLKWIAVACSIGAAGIITGTLVPAWAPPLLLGAVMAMHATTGLAILRYRLYDLDVVLNRTVVYGLLTAALVAIYFGCVVVLQGLALAFTGQQQSQLVTVLSTLLIAGLFSPLRGRLQAAIDRRFFRRKYSMAAALEHFGQMLRETPGSDIDQLNADLVQVVQDTLEPASVRLWLRPTHPPRRP